MHTLKLGLAVVSLGLGLGLGSEIQAQVAFVDRAHETGIQRLSFGRGAAMVDIDGDGLLDIIAANDRTPNFFHRQLADHSFEDAGADWGIVPDNRTSMGPLVADFDNDGDPDVYIINANFPGQPNQVLRNDISTGGGLTDVSAASGDGDLSSRNFGGTALDYDLDGDVDLFLTTPGLEEPCALLRNDGNLFFTDVSAAAGLTDLGAFRHCSSGDFNNDGWFDVAIGSHSGANVLYRNNGDGTFTNVAAEAGVQSPLDNYGMVLEDFDNDGWQDLFVPKYLLNPTGTSELYRNNGDGTFSDVTAGSGMTGQTDMGHNTGDLDDDGFPDIFIGTGNPSYPDDSRLFLMTPDGDGGFVGLDFSDESGVTSNGPTRCHGIAMGDFDQDGAIDMYINNGGPPILFDTLEPNFLWHSRGNDNAWTSLRLTGVISNRSAVGARCIAITSSGREVHRMLRVGHGFANTNSPIQRFGIGQDEGIDRIVITWPSGIVQTIHEPPLGRVIDVVEAACLGDANGDGEVDIDDIVHVVLDYGTDGSAFGGDVDGSGLVDFDDIVLVVLNYGSCPGQ
jgi:hypothetical protein